MTKLIKKLSWFEVGIDLASIHYGLGFLLGTGAAIYTKGSTGIIYAVASALGIFSLALISPYYRKTKKPIWDILGDSYDSKVKDITAFLSGIWMLGVTASQVLGGASALALLGIPRLVSSVIISALIFLLSMVKINLLSKIFSSMLLFSSLVLLTILISQGLNWIPISINDFMGNTMSMGIEDTIGILLTTVLITFIGMDFHQFIIESKDDKNAIGGSLFGGFILLILSSLILALVYGAIALGTVNNIGNPSEVIPTILLNFGNKISPVLGVLLSLPILLVSVGSGSGVTRIVSKTISEFNIIGKRFKEKWILNFLAVLFSFIISLSGKSIIDLIVSFYAVYVGTIFIPFMYHLLTKKFKLIPIETKTMHQSLFGGMIISVLILVYSLLSPMKLDTSSTIILLGFLYTSLVIFIKNLKRFLGKSKYSG